KLQDPDCLQPLVNMLDDLNHNVRIHSVFALGQLGNSDAEPALIKAMKRKEMTRVKVRILEALGKVGTERSFPVMIKYCKSDNDDLRGGAARGLARMALRNLTDTNATESLMSLLADDNAEVRWKAAYALMRVGKDLDAHRLIPACFDDDPRVRMFAVRALGQAHELSALESLGKIIQSDRDWRVRVNAANALANYRLGLVANYLSLLDQGPHVRLAIIQAIGESMQHESGGYQQNSREHNFAKHELEQVFMPETDGESHRSPVEIGVALISYAQMLGRDAIDVILQFKDNKEVRVRARTMTALGETGSPTVVTIFEREYPDAPTPVKIAILGGLAKLKNISTSKLFLKALQENDPVLTAIAADGLSQDTVKNRIYAPRIIEAYQSLPKPVDIELSKIMVHAIGVLGDQTAVPILEETLSGTDRLLSEEAARALHHITGHDYSDSTTTFTPPLTKFRYKDVLNSEGARVAIQTQRGTIEFKLLTHEAPLTVLNFIKLVENGFFNNLPFHRVVPNFVIQAGDPRGDGWGSPGYAIRSEFNLRPFRRGSVGMASAGKDTEGSQFFITHSPQPHLDGRYTVFGQVTSGMDVVDAIQEGDVMNQVLIKR
ncbi:MAG: peptidylprolyl isomerase, partial [bacterium]